MAKINAINNFTTLLTIDPGSSGDSYTQFSINTTDLYKMGVDDDDNDSFKISIGDALGTADAMVIDSDGIRTLPLQPTFYAYLGSTPTSVTGDGTAYIVACNLEVADYSGDYDTSTFTFTAPVTGKYMFGGNTAYQCQPTTGGLTYQVYINTSNRIHYGVNNPSRNTVTNFFSTNAWLVYAMRAFADMDAADVATLVLMGSGGSKTDAVGGNATANPITYFYGNLVC